MKNKIYQNVGTKSNRKIVERNKTDTPNTHVINLSKVLQINLLLC
jgi:hypothetical protein